MRRRWCGHRQDRFEPFPLTDVQAAYSVGRTSAFRWGGVGCHGYAEFAVDHTVAKPTPEEYRVAWRKVVDAHDMLRCVVHPDGYQVICPALGDGLTVYGVPIVSTSPPSARVSRTSWPAAPTRWAKDRCTTSSSRSDRTTPCCTFRSIC